MKNNLEKIKENDEFNSIIQDLVNDETVCKMKNFRQHYYPSCFDHCYSVAYYNYIICNKLGLDYVSCSRAGMLHDLFLYDWREKKDDRKGLHAFTHPRTALNNARKITYLNEKEQDIILKHMWPITIIFPKYLESYVITLTDKYCALKEFYYAYLSNRKVQKYYCKYAYFLFYISIFSYKLF